MAPKYEIAPVAIYKQISGVLLVLCKLVCTRNTIHISWFPYFRLVTRSITFSWLTWLLARQRSLFLVCLLMYIMELHLGYIWIPLYAPRPVSFIHFSVIVHTILIPSIYIPNNATHVNFQKSDPTDIKTEILKFSGMSSLFTITFMSVVRYLSVVCLQRTWHLRTNNKYRSSKLIWLLWGLSFLFAAPPLVGLGQYQKDLSKFW